MTGVGGWVVETQKHEDKYVSKSVLSTLTTLPVI